MVDYAELDDRAWAGEIAQAEKAIKLESLIAEPDTEDDDTFANATWIKRETFAGSIDHTLLKFDATADRVDDLCREAKEEGFACVCVRYPFVARCVDNLQGTSVAVACVIGFHEGTFSPEEESGEALAAITAGATELDLVQPHHLLTQRDAASSAPAPYSALYKHLKQVYDSMHDPKLAVNQGSLSPTIKLKTILETSQLDPSQTLASSIVALAAGADMVKTSTGFNGRGASKLDVRIMSAAAKYWNGRHTDDRRKGVKASGGVRTLDAARQMLELGAGRIGTSSGVAIMREWEEQDRNRQKGGSN